MSHQGIGGRHPDPYCEQLQVLQDALRRLRSEVQVVHPSLVTEFTQPTCKSLPTKKLFLKPLFLWYDYCSCPQHSQHSLEMAIGSIPKYIARCLFFFALPRDRRPHLVTVVHTVYLGRCMSQSRAILFFHARPKTQKTPNHMPGLDCPSVSAENPNQPYP